MRSETPDQPQGSATTADFMSPPVFPMSDPLINLSFDHSYSFDSTAANLEYSMLSALLGNPSAQDDAEHQPPSPPPSNTIAHLPITSNSNWPSLGLDSSYNSPGKPMDVDIDFYNRPGTGTTRKSSIGISPSSALQFRANDNALAPPTPPISDPNPASPVLVATSPIIQMRGPLAG